MRCSFSVEAPHSELYGDRVASILSREPSQGKLKANRIVAHLKTLSPQNLSNILNKQRNQPRLTRNPHLENFIKQGRFLTGYSQGGQEGELISIFVCHSPWSSNCLQATAGECIESGEIIIVSDDLPWSLSGRWKAYNPHQGN